MAARQHKERQANELSSALRVQYEPRNKLIKEIRALRFMEKPVHVPPAYKQSTVEVRTPLMNDLVQRLAGALSVNFPQIKVPPRPKGDQAVAQRNSSLLEEWTTAFLQEIEHQENDRVFYRFLDYLCGDGHGVLKLVHKSEFWTDLPAYDDNPRNAGTYLEDRFDIKTTLALPFSLKAIDPMTFYPRYSEAGLQEVVEYSTRPRIYVAREFGITGWSDDEHPIPLFGQNIPADTEKTLSGSCIFEEHWDKERVDYYVDGRWVDGLEHGYGAIPYFHAMGTQTSSRDPDKEGLSVGHQLRYIVPALDALMTMKTNSAFITNYPAFKRERDLGSPMRVDESEEVDGDTAGEEFEPGHIYEGLPGESLEPIEMPPVNKDVDDSISMLLGMVDKVGVPSVLAGAHSPNRVSGYAYSEMLNVSRTKYTTIIRNASFVYESMIKFLWNLIEKKIGESVPLWGKRTDNGEVKETWLSIGPDDIRGYRAVKVIIEPLLPEDDIAQGQHAAAMVQAGLVSKRWARELKLGIANPEAMDDEILVEHLMELPQLQMYLTMKALERLDMEELAEVFQVTAEQVQQGLMESLQGGGPQVGRPGLPNNAPGAGGPGMPGRGGGVGPPPGMGNGGSPNPPPPGPPAVSPV